MRYVGRQIPRSAATPATEMFRLLRSWRYVTPCGRGAKLQLLHAGEGKRVGEEAKCVLSCLLVLGIDWCAFFHVLCSPLALAERCSVVYAGGSYIIWRNFEVGGAVAEGEPFKEQWINKVILYAEHGLLVLTTMLWLCHYFIIVSSCFREKIKSLKNEKVLLFSFFRVIQMILDTTHGYVIF